MGCWGVGPYDNDSAGDFIASLADKYMAIVNFEPSWQKAREAALRAAKKNRRAKIAAVPPEVRARERDRMRGLYEEARVAIELVLGAHGTDILGGPDLSKAREALTIMLDDVEWAANYDKPREMWASLREQIARIDAVLDRERETHLEREEKSRADRRLQAPPAGRRPRRRVCPSHVRKRPKKSKAIRRVRA